MDVESVFLVENEPEWDDAGVPPETSIAPDPEWIDRP
jgi:hypothetical protein